MLVKGRWKNLWRWIKAKDKEKWIVRMLTTTANLNIYGFSSIHELNFGVYHEARQSSQLFSPDRFRLIGKVVRFQHRGTHWWAAPLYQKQRNWLDCLASWYTPKFNSCILLKAKWAVSFCWLPPVLTSNRDGDLKKAFNECLGVSNVFPTAA